MTHSAAGELLVNDRQAGRDPILFELHQVERDRVGVVGGEQLRSFRQQHLTLSLEPGAVVAESDIQNRLVYLLECP